MLAERSRGRAKLRLCIVLFAVDVADRRHAGHVARKLDALAARFHQDCALAAEASHE